MATATSGIDPVCGMAVDLAAARDKWLSSEYQDAEYLFCGKGCKLAFDDDPDHYLGPRVPAVDVMRTGGFATAIVLGASLLVTRRGL